MLAFLWGLVAYSLSGYALPVKRDADYANVRSYTIKNFNNVDLDKPDKYFHEARFSKHYDGRFASGRLPYDQQHASLILLAQTYLSTMNEIGVETWIMHGTLLGWYWNRRILPWDTDVDVQMSDKSINYLAGFYNMTSYRYRLPGTQVHRDYLLEINPNHTNATLQDENNMIDGRWIDTETGLYIDITALRRNLTAEAEGKRGAMMCKDRHHYMYDEIYPLRPGTFEGAPVRIPYAFADILAEEYHDASMTRKHFEGHTFNESTREWERDGRYPPQEDITRFLTRFTDVKALLGEGKEEPGNG